MNTRRYVLLLMTLVFVNMLYLHAQTKTKNMSKNNKNHTQKKPQRNQKLAKQDEKVVYLYKAKIHNKIFKLLLDSIAEEINRCYYKDTYDKNEDIFIVCIINMYIRKSLEIGIKIEGWGMYDCDSYALYSNGKTHFLFIKKYEGILYDVDPLDKVKFIIPKGYYRCNYSSFPIIEDPFFTIMYDYSNDKFILVEQYGNICDYDD